MIRWNADTQKLVDIETSGKNHWLRIFCKDGEIFDAYVDCETYVTIGDDEDVDALSFTKRDGSGYDVAGVEIDRFEVLEKR